VSERERFSPNTPLSAWRNSRPYLDRHTIFLTETEIIFVFEGNGAAEAVRSLFNDPVRSTIISRWLPLFDGPLHQAPEAYVWKRQEMADHAPDHAPGT